MTPDLDRRRFLTRALGALGAGGAGAAAVALGTGGGAARAAATPDLEDRFESVSSAELGRQVPFDAAHQSGVLTDRPAQATYLALDSVAPSQTVLFETLQALSARARQLAAGTPVAVVPIDDTPPDSGILGPYDAPDSLTVNISYGHALSDDRYGLRRHRPAHLTPMRVFADDALEPARCGGDVLLQIAAGQRDTVMHTVRELLRETAGNLVVRWTLDGFQTARRGPHSYSNTRNLFAFRDGTGNPAQDPATMDRLIWVRGGRGGEPAFSDGGTYVVVRVIRQLVEFWDRVGMFEQEKMIGRERVSGAPLGGTDEFEDPDYASDPHGLRIPLDAHIRMANPRTPQTADERMIRRSYSYDRGVDEAGNLDCGLIFTAFNQNPKRQFETVQERLESEPMVDYIRPVGGGYFFAPRGAQGPGDWVGSGLAA